MKRRTESQARSVLRERLGARRGEIEEAALTRVLTVSGQNRSDAPEYGQGLRLATSAALDYGLDAIELGERSGSVPATLLEQARQAARHEVSLDTVLRRYFAGFALLGDFLSEECEQSGQVTQQALREVQRSQATLFDRLIARVSTAYAEECGGPAPSRERRRRERVERLLAGELVSTAEFDYEFDCWHLGLVVGGPANSRVVREIGAALDRRALTVKYGDSSYWIWLGGRIRPDSAELDALVHSLMPEETTLAIGEPGYGPQGWRLTHEQARAAMSVCPQGARRVLYTDVALLASMVRDDLLATSLRQIYLTPLGKDRDGGATAYRTLRAYFDSNRNASSAAAALGVNRHTVSRRLRAIEERFSQPLDTLYVNLEAALRLARAGHPGEGG